MHADQNEAEQLLGSDARADVKVTGHTLSSASPLRTSYKAKIAEAV